MIELAVKGLVCLRFIGKQSDTNHHNDYNVRSVICVRLLLG